MAYPIKLFDFQSKEGQEAGTEFLFALDKTLTESLGIVPKGDKIKKFHKWETVPEFLVDLGNESVQKILKDLPEGELRWEGSVGIYGRKSGSTVKRKDGVLYRLVIHLGSTEVYRLMGEAFEGEPIVLPNGWALLCSPVMVDNVDIRVEGNPIRKNLDARTLEFVSKIRPRDYLRSTIVLDLMLDGIENLSDLTIEKTCPPELPLGSDGEDTIEADHVHGPECEGSHE